LSEPSSASDSLSRGGGSPDGTGSRTTNQRSTSPKTTIRVPLTSAHGAANRSVQVNGTPRRKPRNSGGSPSGVSSPAPLATMKMKKMTMWRRRVRRALARSSGRIKSAEAPVVPTTLASTEPMAKKSVLTSGVPASEPRK